jgi:hypothetical protein
MQRERGERERERERKRELTLSSVIGSLLFSCTMYLRILKDFPAFLLFLTTDYS